VVCAAVEYLVALYLGCELKDTWTELEQFFKVCIPKLQRLHRKHNKLRFSVRNVCSVSAVETVHSTVFY